MSDLVGSRLFIRDSADKIRLKIDDDLVIRGYDEAGSLVFELGLTATLALGGNGEHGDILMLNEAGERTVHISGQEGDVILTNADAAEDFDVVDAEGVEPGSVLVIDDHSHLAVSTVEYDRRVAGVVSGAGEYRPGIVLDRQGSRSDRLPVALMGKVYVNANASQHPISVGDLLTTSGIPGHAMKATDSDRAFGAVIGKALGPLPAGIGQVPILVSLQ